MSLGLTVSPSIVGSVVMGIVGSVVMGSVVLSI